MSPAGQETVFVCLAGTATIEVNKERFAFTKHDTLYLPKDMQAIVASEDHAYASEQTILLSALADVTMSHDRRCGWGSSSAQCC
jgi:gentisate 1,2-dioxygenase